MLDSLQLTNWQMAALAFGLFIVGAVVSHYMRPPSKTDAKKPDGRE